MKLMQGYGISGDGLQFIATWDYLSPEKTKTSLLTDY